MVQEILQNISPAQWLVFFGGILAFISTVAYGSWKLFAAWFNQRMEKERAISQAAIEADRLRAQSQLDSTEYSRETTRSLLSELTESRKEDNLSNERMRLALEKQDERHNEHLKNITDVSRGVENLLATALEILKEHKEISEVSDIKQQKIINQNDTTHSKLTEISTDLTTLAKKLENLSVIRDSDRRTLEDIQSNVLSLKNYIETLNDRIITQALPHLDEAGNAVIPMTNQLSPSIVEVDKELNQKTNEGNE